MMAKRALHGVLPVSLRSSFHRVELDGLAEEGDYLKSDTATGWAESWGAAVVRIKRKRGLKPSQRGGNNWRWKCTIVVSRSMTSTTLIYLGSPKAVERVVLDNGSVTVLWPMRDGAFHIEKDWGSVLS